MIKHKNYMNSFKDYYDALGYKPINIDKKLNKNEILKILKMKNKSKYVKYFIHTVLCKCYVYKYKDAHYN